MKNTTLQQLLDAGCHFGHQVRKWNPAMKQYIYTQKDGVHVFDLEKTKEGLDTALKFVTELVKDGKKILFVGTKRQAQEIVKREALRAGMPYVTQRWMGGMLTNYSQLGKRVARMKDLKAKKASGELASVYTKFEQLQFDREIAKLERFFAGVSDMNEMPGALFVVDTHREDVSVREARRMGVPVIGIVDSNANPGSIDYVIPSNDDAVKAIELMVGLVADTIVEAK